MSFQYGFYNSVGGDRMYDATQFGDLFTGLISDGVYQGIGDEFLVSPGGELNVFVGRGSCWFNKSWSNNTTVMTLQLELSDLLLPRYDMVVLEVDQRSFGRQNSIKIVTGTPSANPERPAISNAANLYQYPLAYIYVKQNAETISVEDIDNQVGKTIPYVTAKLPFISIDDAFVQLQGQFEDWMESVDAMADKDAVISLKFQLDAATAKVEEVSTLTTKLQDELDSIKANL